VQDTSQDDKNFLITELKAENIKLETANKALSQRWESLARTVLDLQETVIQLKNEINRLKGQKSRPKFPPAKLNKGDKESGNQTTNQRSAANPGSSLKKSNTTKSS